MRRLGGSAAATWLLAGALLSSCTAHPTEGRFACATPADCPSGWFCVDNGAGALRCYSTPAGPVDMGTPIDGGDVDLGPACPGGCDDHLACTHDACGASGCTHAMEPDATPCGPNQECMVGACECVDGFGDCDAVPGCEANFATDAMHCGSCTMACEGGMSCIARACGMCTSIADCDDSLVCTTDACSGGACTHVVNNGCLIAGVCYADGAVDPANPCHVCSAVMHTVWSPNSGARCDDGVVAGCGLCDSGGACGTGTTCNDSQPCTTDTCTDSTGACGASVTTGCLIGGTCIASGGANPSNPCQICSPGASTTAYSAAPAGTTCDDGNSSTCDDQCAAGGACGGVTPSCNDSNDCTRDFVDCSGPFECGHFNEADGASCAGPSRGHCCGGMCRDFGNCCGGGSCGFGGVCPGACESFTCCMACGGGGTDCSA